MDNGIKIRSVREMQEYIIQHINDENFPFKDFYSHTGYSQRHADRLFKELTGKTPREYVRSVKLSDSSQKLLKKGKKILDVALESEYNSHEGYIKAFTDEFGIPPGKYKKGKNPIQLFIPYPVKENYRNVLSKEEDCMENKTCLCMITPVQRPKRKLIYLRSKAAHDYWSYCEERCCDWEGLFNSILSKFDTAAILTLPQKLIKPGYGSIAAGVEVPYEYDGEIPEDCEIAELDPCEMLFFESQAFNTDDEFFFLIGEVFKAVDTFNASSYGYEYADELAPRFNFGGKSGKGAKLAIPIRRIK